MASKTKKKFGASDAILILGVLVIMIPVIYLLSILLGAAKVSNVPINGNRFEGERTVEITTDQMSSLEAEIEKISGVEDCKTELRVATLRVYVDVSDSLSKEEYEGLLMQVYEKIDSALPVGTYFTASGSVRQYDLEIHTYNSLELKEGEEFIYRILVKNSNMETYQINEVSDARNEELAKELRGENQSETTVDGEGEEEAPAEEGNEENTGE